MLNISKQETAFCGLFGAAALLLPVIFHIFRLGHIFMPMYLPLVTLCFFVRPLPAFATSFVVPLLSGAVTGMPPFFPPVAVFMSIELAAMSFTIAAICSKWPKANEWLVLIPILIMGRILYVALVYFFALFIDLPGAFLAGLSFLKGWPGIILMIVIVPPLARNNRSIRLKTINIQKEN
jgi:thiamine transporter ThiT